MMSGSKAVRKNLRMYRCIILILLSSVLLNYGCTAPQYIWPQTDIESYEINQKTLEKRILIASRKSEFKSAIVKRVQKAFLEKAVYIKIIGIETLRNEDAKQYSAVLIINTCMGWRIDRKVEAFLEKYGGLNSIIVLTTSDGGDILPDMERRQIDAISSASVKERINPIADEIISKIDKLIGATASDI